MRYGSLTSLNGDTLPSASEGLWTNSSGIRTLHRGFRIMAGTAVTSGQQCFSATSIPLFEVSRVGRRPLYSLVRITYCSDPAGISYIGRAIELCDGGVSFEIHTPLYVCRLIMLKYTDTNDDCRYRRRTAKLHRLMKHTFFAYFEGPARLTCRIKDRAGAVITC
jgi:hypothetical protein